MALKSDLILELVKNKPELSNRQIAEEVGCSRRLVRYVRNTGSHKRVPKILILDIETSPMEVYVWGLYKQRIPIQNIIKDWSLLSWSAKWLFDNKIVSQRVTAKEAIERKDGSIIGGLWKLLDACDLVVGHNVRRFDVRKANTRFLINKLQPTSPYRMIDTLSHAMRVFSSPSYKLNYLNKIFGNQAKLEAPYQLWVDAVNGSVEALKKMETYNRFDVVVTEELYVTLRPWMKGHPNLGLYIDTDKTVCTNCGNQYLSWLGFYYTPAGKYRAFRCTACGAVGRSRFSELNAEEKKRMLLSVAA